jgi:D-alanyl-lipoteichoic acid acyltransferase DltB (MBOAT superfamily)
MSLGDPLYFVFLAIVFLVFHALAPGMPRRVWLLAGSYFFYFKFSQYYIAVLLFVTLVTYFGARAMRGRPTEKNGLLVFWLVIAVVSGPLLVLRYAGAMLQGVHGCGFLPATIPVGISFFTFVALGYLIDVYLEVAEPEEDLSRVALLLACFPLISAGPIERATHFLPQFELDAPFSSKNALNSLRLIFIGLILKLLIAVQLEPEVTAIMGAPRGLMPIEHLVGVINSAFYLYADFAGYTLIAIGSAGLFGLTVSPNFQQPFFSTTIPEFWRRWHMSLSFWVRDYLFVPLRTAWRGYKKTGMLAAMLVSFVILGGWHGPKWGYVVFGLMQGMLAVTSTVTLARRDAFWKSIRMPFQVISLQRMVATFFLFALTLVPFRTATLGDAWYIYHSVFSFELLRNSRDVFLWRVFHHGMPMLLTFGNNRPWVLIPPIIIGDILVRRKITLEKFPTLLQGAIYMIGLIEILATWMDKYVTHPFVYNKF